MNKLYPLKFNPVFREKIWGGEKIHNVLDFSEAPEEMCGEAWVLSAVEGDETIVSNGFLAGNELNELLEVYMGDLVGDSVYERFGNQFPLLIKFIDASDWLSIQVHPDDALAKKRNIGNGKTEMWYILEADPGAQLISGFSKEVNANVYIDQLKQKKLKEILNFEDVEQADCFFMPSGRVHALGPGILMAEIQQSSDTTYRIYDWDRTDDQGKGRELHIEEALDAIDFKTYPEYKNSYDKIENGSSNLVDSPYFSSNLINVAQSLKKNYTLLDSFVIYLCVEGEASIISRSEETNLKKGDCLLIPSELEEIIINPMKKTQILEVYIQ